MFTRPMTVVLASCFICLTIHPRRHGASDGDPRRPMKPRPKLTPKVLIIGVDGVRPDALKAADTPHCDALIADGAYSDQGHHRHPHRQRPVLEQHPHRRLVAPRHGVTDNSFDGLNADAWPDVLTIARQAKPGLRKPHPSLTGFPSMNTWIRPATCTYRHTHDYDDDGDVKMLARAVDVLRDLEPGSHLLLLRRSGHGGP